MQGLWIVGNMHLSVENSLYCRWPSTTAYVSKIVTVGFQISFVRLLFLFSRTAYCNKYVCLLYFKPLYMYLNLLCLTGTEVCVILWWPLTLIVIFFLKCIFLMWIHSWGFLLFFGVSFSIFRLPAFVPPCVWGLSLGNSHNSI